MNSIFRMIILFHALSLVVLIVFPQIWGVLYSSEELGLILNDGFGASVILNGFSGWIFTLAYFFILIGLACLKLWARTALLYITIFAIVVSPFYGVSVQGGYDVLISLLATLLQGAVIGISYLAPINWRAKEKANAG